MRSKQSARKQVRNAPTMLQRGRSVSASASAVPASRSPDVKAETIRPTYKLYEEEVGGGGGARRGRGRGFLTGPGWG